VTGWIGPERGQVDDGEVRDVAVEFVAIRPDQKIADEQRVPGEFGKDPRPDPVLGIRAAVEILREKLLAFRVREKVSHQRVELLGRDRAVVVPPDGALG
jgi:hypothetical protein